MMGLRTLCAVTVLFRDFDLHLTHLSIFARKGFRDKSEGPFVSRHLVIPLQYDASRLKVGLIVSPLPTCLERGEVLFPPFVPKGLC